MPNRTYICRLSSGMGNFGHMISRSRGNMALNPEFRKHNPESYILVGGSEEQNKALIDKLSKLDSAHPLHISNLHTAGNPTGKLYIISSQDSIPYNLIQDAIVYRVSTVVAVPFKEDSKGFLVENLQFGSSDLDMPDDPLIRNMGFGPSGYGIFIENNPTAKTINEKVAADLTQALLNCDDKELAGAILGNDVHEQGVQAIKAFHNGERVLISLYSHREDDVNEYIDAIKGSPAMQGKYLVFVVTGKGRFTEEPKQAGYAVIKRDYIDQNLYSIINQLKTSDIAFASGDKSFEEAISAGAVPIIFGFSSFMSSSYDFVDVIARMKVEEKYLEQHKKVVELLRASDMSKKLSLLTPELVKYWQAVCIPYIKKNWNYYEKIPAFEEQAVALYELKQDPTKKDLWGKFNDAEKIHLLQSTLEWNFKVFLSLIESINSDAAIALESEEQQNPVSTGAKATLLSSEQAISVYEKGWCTVADVIKEKDSNKIKALISDDATSMYRQGYAKFDQLSKINDVSKLSLLTSWYVRDMYDERYATFDQLVKVEDVERIKTLTSWDAKIIYKRKWATFDQLSKTDDAQKLKVLTSVDVLKACTTWEKLKFTDLLDLNVEQIRKVINSDSPVEVLEEIKTQISADISKLVIAATKGDLDLVKELGGKLSKEAMDKANEKGWSALTAATYYGQEEVVKELVEHFHVDRNQAETNVKTASNITELPCTEDVLGVAGEIVKKAKPLN